MTGAFPRFIVFVEIPRGFDPFWMPMGSFGEDLRTERLSRGVALEDITAVTKISQRHLVALEEDKYRQLPGGILSKGIVRGYVGALGLDERDWTERFVLAYASSGQVLDDDRSWMAFASNVGKARIQKREAAEMRLRWLGAVLLVIAASAGIFLTVRYFGVRAGWWTTLLPLENHLVSMVERLTSGVQAVANHAVTWWKS